MTEFPPGTVLRGHYRIDHALARGGTSRIYVAQPLRGAGLVAIKQLVSTPDEMDEDLRHFRREFELLSRLRHPSLPRALELFADRGFHFLAEEFVPGDNLQQRIERHGRLSVQEASTVTLHLLEVLAYLHGQGVIYRDLKPDNVLVLRDGTPRLIDFGAARRFRAGVTRDTVLLGTPGYASPEHYGSAQTDARSDVYTAGAILHAMLTGRNPADGPMWQFPRPGDVHPDIPEAVGEVAMQALHLDPGERYQSAGEMRNALAAAVGLTQAFTSAAGFATLDWHLERRLEFTALQAFSGGRWGWLSAWSRWRRLGDVSIDLCLEGIRMRSHLEDAEFAWEEIQRVRMLRSEPDGRPLSADVSGGTQVFHLDADWPGFTEVVDAIIRQARLVESAQPWSAYCYVGTRVETFDREDAEE